MRLDNGFLARFSFDDANQTIVPIIAWGDPIDFETLEQRCDPL